MNNTIADRVADFLKRFPPFDLLRVAELRDISRQVKIKYMEKDMIVYAQNDPVHEVFYLINKGAVALKKELNDKTQLIDKFDEGDVFGLRPLFAEERYTTSALTDEECILYALPIKDFKPLVQENKDVRKFVIESFAANTENPYSQKFADKFYVADDGVMDISSEIFELQPVKYVKKVVTAVRSSKIKTIARLMSENKIGSVIIEEDSFPIGIVTQKDLIDSLAKSIPLDRSVSEIMSSPVLCYPKNISITQAQITMMKHKVNHICITKDGTPNSKIIGIVANHDIVVMKGSNPSVLMKAIKRSNSTKELKRIREKVMMLLDGYIEQNIPLTHITKIFFELNDATLKRIIERCITKMGTEPPVTFAWMSLGSLGRKEQVLQTDQDNALVFEDVKKENLEAVRTYFLALAKKVNKRLDKIGFSFCEGEIMAKNPKWCLSLSEWKIQFSNWISTADSEEILLCSIFFDFDIAYGNAELTAELSEHVLEFSRDRSIFIHKLAASALRSPSPFGFFRQFLLEADGAHKDQFDLKKRGIMPITDAGRVLALHYHLKYHNNTADRFEALASLVPGNEELYQSCSYASKALLKFRIKYGRLQKNNGRFIDLSALSKEEKMKLKRCFKIITKLQQLLKIKFGVNQYL